MLVRLGEGEVGGISIKTQVPLSGPFLQIAVPPSDLVWLRIGQGSNPGRPGVNLGECTGTHFCCLHEPGDSLLPNGAAAFGQKGN